MYQFTLTSVCDDLAQLMLLSISSTQPFFSVAQQPNSGLGPLIVEVSRSHTNAVGLLWTRDQLVAEAAT